MNYEKQVKSIGAYLGCNEAELWSETKKLLLSLLSDIKKEMPSAKEWGAVGIGATILKHFDAILNQKEGELK